jgi:predicted ATPase/class 3 adenylate cyclase
VDCPHCGTTNRELAAFCRQCGHLLRDECPRCRAFADTEANFCDACGYPLSPRGWIGSWPQPELRTSRPSSWQNPEPPRPTNDEAENGFNLERFIPQELATKLRSIRESGISGERRIVTILFCDIKGSTALAERLDPEDWSEIVNGAFERMVPPIFKYEGTVARLTGDGLLAFFGAPIAHEDDPRRAILAGLEIVAGIHKYRESLPPEIRNLDVRIGINTGLVVVGAVGSDMRLEYSALGDAINLAARMEQTAMPGTVQIADDTFRQVAGQFAVEPLGGIEVKGKAEPVSAYRVLRRRSGREMRQLQTSFHAPLINRTREWETLQEAFSGLVEGHGRILILTGDAGIGKSRLIYEAMARLLPETENQGRFVETVAFAYETSQPFGLIARLMRQMLGLVATDGPEIIRERIAEAGFSEDDQTMAFRVLETLFGSAAENSAGRLQGEEFARTLFSCMEQFWINQAGIGPLVIVLDDLQWIDASSADLITRLYRLADSEAILFLCAVRRDRHSYGWRLKETVERDFPHRLVEIPLYPLTDADSRRLLTGLLGASDLHENLQTAILEKSEGNPLFVEEVVSHIIERGLLVREGDDSAWTATGGNGSIDLPDSLQALLTARIDRLDEDTRRTLQIAAVIGRFFPRSPLAALVDQPDLLADQLLDLQRMELIRETTRVPEPGYTFHHALTHEATYNTILVKQRRMMHRRVAETIESLRAGYLTDVAPILAHHYLEGGQPALALPYLIMAADNAMILNATTEAVAFCDRALPIALEQDESVEKVIHIFNARGRAMELQSRFKDADQTYQELEQIGLERGDRAMELQGIIAQGKLRSNVTPFYDPVSGKALMDRALKLAQELGDRTAEVRILWNLINIGRFDVNSLQEAVALGDQALEMARELGLEEEEAYLLNDLADVYGTIGQVEKGMHFAEQAHDRWRALGNEPMLADSLTNASMLAYMRGDFDEAQSLSGEAYNITSRIGNAWGQGFSLGMRGIVRMYKGEIGLAFDDLTIALVKAREGNFMGGQLFIHAAFAQIYQEAGLLETAIEHAKKGIQIGREFIPQFLGLGLARLVLIQIAMGQVDAAVETFESNLEFMENDNIVVVNDIMISKAELALARKEYDQVIKMLTAIEEVYTKNGNWGFLPDAQYIHARALLAIGELDEAHQLITAAVSLVRRIGMRLNLWRYLTIQVEIEQRASASEEHPSLWHEIQTELEFLAENISQEDLRRSFLDLPPVQAALEEQRLVR